MSDMSALEKRVESIEKRNERVESDKAWETSLVRRLLIACFTYIVIVLFFITAELPQPFVNAIVPSLAFLLSTVTVGFVKKWWVSKQL